MKIRLFEEYSDGTMKVSYSDYSHFMEDRHDKLEDFNDDEINLIRSIHKDIDINGNYRDRTFLSVRIFTRYSKSYSFRINMYSDEWYLLEVEEGPVGAADVYETRSYYICDQLYSLIDTMKRFLNKKVK